MSRRCFSLSALLALSLLQIGSTVYAQAPTLVDNIPGDVRGFAVLKNVDRTIDKVEALANRFQVQLPPLKQMLGNFDDGFDAQGDIGVAWLGARDGDDPESSYRHVVAFLPVTDYQAFVQQFHPADADAKIVAVSFNGQEFSLAKKGPFAVVADIEDSASMEHVLASKNSVAKTAASISAWSNQNDLTVSLTPQGTQWIFTKLKEGLATIKTVAMQSAGENSQMIEAALGFYESLFDYSERECEQFAIGLRIDPENSLSLHKRVVLAKGGSLAGASKDFQPVDRPLADIPAGAFVIAFDGAMPRSLSKDWMAMSFQMLNKMQVEDGEPLSQDTIDKLSESAARTMGGLKSMAFVMGVGDAGGGIYDRTVGVMRTENAGAFLRNYAQAFDEMTELMKGSPWAGAYALEQKTIDGKPAIHLTMDMTKFRFVGSDTAEDLNEHYNKMFGNDGKLSVYLTATDETTVAMAYSSVENLQRVVNVARAGSLAGDPQVAKTAAMLPSDAQWRGYISPGGILEFAGNMAEVFAPGVSWDLGQYPASPPVGFAVQLAPDYLEGRLVVPLETINSAKTFVEQMQQ